MPPIASLITPERVVCGLPADGKQQALEHLGQLLTRGMPDIAAATVLASLVVRERSGSTGLGRGIAFPHGRLPGLPETIGACIRLDTAIDFAALDNRPVDLVFALLVPEESPDTHLQWLAQLAQMFSDTGFAQQLRAARDDHELYTLLSHWEPRRATA
ncbi:MAG: PTS sugar transporter subunit IIA [Gammaproteobacteria bacterium]|nr:PTS sugar transporter subunit IIA [Gammaproteobacteria bacterium]